MNRIGLVLLLNGLCATGAGQCMAADAPADAGAAHRPRNVIIFVADGLRRNSVNATDAPTLLYVRRHGVNFANSHSMFPTFTTPNASAIATGHSLGDSGIFGNNLFVGFPVFGAGNFAGKQPGSSMAAIENDQTLGDLDEHFEGRSVLGEETLLAFARRHGYSTAAIGKLGPTLIQDVIEGNPTNGRVPPPQTIVIDDLTGRNGGVPLSDEMKDALKRAQLPDVAPNRSNGQSPHSPFNNGYGGDCSTPGTRAPNLLQQTFFVNAATRVVLPTFVREGKPFAMVYWSRDPDGSQHNEGDSLNKLKPGINGPTSRNGILNADHNLKQILDYIDSNPDLKGNTDVFVTSDHGFATISRHELDPHGDHTTTSYAASITYKNAAGALEVAKGFLPPGFLAIDLGHALGLPLYDARAIITDADGTKRYKPVDPTIGHPTPRANQFPSQCSAILGGRGLLLDQSDARLIVAGNGGSDLIYVPSHDAALLRKTVDFLFSQDYVSGVFVDDSFGGIPGTLPTSAINLRGSARVPLPAIVVNFRSFSLEHKHPLQTEIVIADTGLQEGQGMHGSFGRGETFNNMAAIGPDFKAAYTDHTPVSNADITMTLAHVLGFAMPSRGHLNGRVIVEALANGPESIPHTIGVLASKKGSNGRQTFVDYQDAQGVRYFDAAGFEGRTVELKTSYAAPSERTKRAD